MDRRRELQRIIRPIIMGVTIWSDIGLAQHLEDRLIHATPSQSSHLFSRNPSLFKSDKTIITATRALTRREYEVIGNPDDSATPIKMQSIEKEDAAGVLLPLGGAAVGFTTEFGATERIFDNADSGRDHRETFRHRRHEVRFLVDLTESLRGAFAYKYRWLQNDIYGGFGIQSNDRTRYRGNLSGYTIGLFQEIGAGGIGIFHAPPMRGKATVEGEQKIMSDPGVTGIDIIYKVTGELSLGLSAEKWFHKRDDFLELSTSPINDGRISLNGLDLEQYLLKTQSIRIGCDYLFSNEWRLRTGLARHYAVFLFRDDAVPGDKKDSEKPIQYYDLRLAVSYTRNDFNIEIGKGLIKRELDHFNDYRWSLGYGEYESYRAKDDITYVALSFAK